MHFIDNFIKRPVLSCVIALLFIVAGIGGALSLQVKEYPAVNSSVITISTTYSGAIPSIMEGFVTIPLEQSIATAEGIDYMYSQSISGLSTITVYTAMDANPNAVLTQIVQNVNAVLSDLPTGTQMPSVTINSANNFPALILAFTSDDLNRQQISSYLVNVLTPRLLSLGGLSEVEILGEQNFAMRIYMDQQKLIQYGLTPSDIGTMLTSNSLITAGGEIKADFVDYTINAETILSSAEDYEKLIVKTAEDGSIIRLRDVAKVQLGAETYDTDATMNRKTVVGAGAILSANANATTVVQNIINHLPQIKQHLPPGLEVNIAYNSNLYIEASIDDVVSALIEAAIIVGVVLFLFIGSVRSVIIPAVAIPISLIGSFFLMKLMGFSINLLTLLSMVLAIGLVVDDAIVVLENIYRHMEEGKSPMDASIVGAREIANPVILMTLTLVAVYIPIGMVGGFTGILFVQFAYSLAGAVVISGVVAYTFSPMLCSRILKPSITEARMVKFVDSIFDRIKTGYTKTLTTLLSVRVAMLLFAIAILSTCYIMFTGIKTELAPVEDQSFIGIQGTAPANANIYYLNTFSPAMYDAMEGLPGKQNALVVGGNPQTNNYFGAFVMTPWGDRDVTQMEVQPMLQERLNNVTGAQTYTFTQPALPGIPQGPPMQFVLQSIQSHDQIYPIANQMIKKMMESGNFLLAQSDLMFDNAEITIHIDKEKASSLGITMQDIANALQYSLSGNFVNYFNLYGYSYEVIPKLLYQKRMTTEQLGEIYVEAHPTNINAATGTPNTESTMVPLSSFMTFTTKGAPLSMNRFQQMNSATISAVMAPGITQGQAVDYMEQLAKEVLPPGMEHQYEGSTRTFLQNSDSMMVAFLFAIIVIFLMLAAQFESFRDPLIILITVPMAICGALIPLYFGQIFNLGFASLNIYTELGLVTLIGLISKHGILMVEFANQLQEQEGLNKYEAILKSASFRLRPILMTTAAMVCGVIPLVYASGAGAVSRNCIGIVIASGMTIGTCFTLFVLPCMYMFIAKEHNPSK
jgi:multidrug efflux pump